MIFTSLLDTQSIQWQLMLVIFFYKSFEYLIKSMESTLFIFTRLLDTCLNLFHFSYYFCKSFWDSIYFMAAPFSNFYKSLNTQLNLWQQAVVILTSLFLSSFWILSSIYGINFKIVYKSFRHSVSSVATNFSNFFYKFFGHLV